MSRIATKLNTTGRILLLFISYFIIVGIFQYVGSIIAGVELMNLQETRTSTQELIVSVFDFAGTFLLLWLFMKTIDNERFVKLGFQTKNRLKDFLIGITVGLIIMAIGYSLLILFKEIFFVKVNFDLKELVISIILFTIVAVVEETLFRGYILKNLMNSFNKYIALIITSILFSLMH